MMNYKQKFLLPLLSILFLHAVNTYPMQTALDPKKTTILVDADDVQSLRPIATFDNLQKIWNTKGIVATIIFNKPLSWPYHIYTITTNSLKHVKNNPNMSMYELADTIIDYCKQEQCGDLSSHKEALLRLMINPQPIKPVIELLQQLKNKGFTLVTATNQNYEDNRVYRKRMLEQGIDLDALFSMHITTGAATADKITANQLVTPYLKPAPEYFEFIKKQNYIPAIFLDDRKENTDAAEKCNITSIHFALHYQDGSFKRSKKLTEQELQIATEQMREKFKQLGVQLD